jgi:hypothetical protein
MNLLFLPSFFLLVGVTNAATINICVQSKEEGSTSPLPGAAVQCWDEDIDADDAMTGTSTTGSNGCVTLSYSKKTPKRYNPCTAWDCPGSTNPDIYCRITKTDFYPLCTDTKGNSNQDNIADFGTVTIYPDRTGDATNGCGPASEWDDINEVANFLTGFEDQCNNHDLCYSDCLETQQNCDLEFKYMMYSKCNDSWDFSDKILCKSVADGMYALVRDLGATAYSRSQSNNGCS